MKSGSTTFIKIYKKLFYHYKQILFWPYKFFRWHQPSLHSRITTVFLISFVIFIAVTGSSLLLVFNYQLHRYTQFVGYQYAVQLSRLFEAYYDAAESWQGVGGWLQKNFASGSDIDKPLQITKMGNDRKNSEDGQPKDAGIETRRSKNLEQRLGLYYTQQVSTTDTKEAWTELEKAKKQAAIEQQVQNNARTTVAPKPASPYYPKISMASSKTQPEKPRVLSFASIIQNNSPFFFLEEHLFGASSQSELDLPFFWSVFPNPVRRNTKPEALQMGMLLFSRNVEKDRRENTVNSKKEIVATEKHRGQTLSEPTNFWFYFLSKPDVKNLVVSEKLLAREYLSSDLLSLCLVEPFCSLSEYPPWVSDTLTRSSDSSLPQPILDLWFRIFSQLNNLGALNDLGQLDEQPLQSLHRERGLPIWWWGREDRPDLFAGKQIGSENLLSRLQLLYTSAQQIFVLLDPNSKVLASNMPENLLEKELGALWQELRNYIKDYEPKAEPVDRPAGHSTSTQLSERLNSPFNLNTQTVFWEKRNIFVINDQKNMPVGFLYAQSIVSPIWKNLNQEVNTVIVKVALLSCLMIALIYWLIDRFHLRKLFSPLHKLSHAAAEVRRGNTAARVNEIPKEFELALVTEQFNKMLDSQALELMLREQQYRDVAHELRTPITIISGELQLIQEGVYEANEEKIHALSKQVQQMQRIVQDLEILYQVSQTSNNKFSDMTYSDQVSVCQLLHEAFTAFQTQMKQKGIQFSLEQASLFESNTRYIIRGDSRRLQQVFANCLVNAMRYTPVGGQIEIRGQLLRNVELNKNIEANFQAHGMSLDRDYVLFTIADSGCGIPEEKRELVFERFFRVDDARNHQSGGCGLGLAISKSFIEFHGGLIWAEDSYLQQSFTPDEQQYRHGNTDRASLSESNTSASESQKVLPIGVKFCFALPCFIDSSKETI